MKDALYTQKDKIKLCDSCGATHPWHFQDCPRVPGGEELYVRNLEEKHNWEKEKRVPREQGARILKAINLMLFSPNHEVMLERKAAIQEEVRKE